MPPPSRTVVRAAPPGLELRGLATPPHQRERITPIRTFYARLCQRGKTKKAVLVAAMRKMPTILNAVMRDQTPWQWEAEATMIKT